jgi:hypothetical protein
MSKTHARRLALSVTVLFLTSAVLGQEAEKKGPAPTTARSGCEPGTCVSKVLSLPNFSTAYELQDVVNMFRTIADFTDIYPNQSEHSVSLKGTREQLAIAEKLVGVLESLRASGGRERSSVLVYQLKGSLSGTSEAEKMLVQSPRTASTVCELTSCVIKALYLPDFSTVQLQDTVNKVRSTAQITRTSLSPSNHVIVIRGTSEQVALAEKLTNE